MEKLSQNPDVGSNMNMIPQIVYTFGTFNGQGGAVVMHVDDDDSWWRQPIGSVGPEYREYN